MGRNNQGSVSRWLDLQGEVSTSTVAHKTYGKAEVSIFEQQLSTWLQITKVQFLHLNGSFDLQGEISTSTGIHKTYGKAEVSSFEQQLSTWPYIIKVQVFTPKMVHSNCKERFLFPPDHKNRAVKLKFRFLNNNFRPGPKSPRYSFYT